jgi:acetyl esterase/lipase
VAPVDPREVLTRPGPAPDAVLRYGRHPDQLIDLHLPAAPLVQPTRAPAVLLVHGGFWRQAYDRRHTRPMAGALTQLGFAVASVEYRRSGGAGGWPMTFDDVVAAFDAAPGLVEAVAPGRVDFAGAVALGHSAGGHLAIWAGQRTLTPLRRIVALAPVADLMEAHRRRLDSDAVSVLLGGPPEQLPQRYAQADAAGQLPARVPVVVVHGDQDQQVPVAMSRALRGVELVELAGTDHFGLIDPRTSAWAQVMAAVRS